MRKTSVSPSPQASGQAPHASAATGFSPFTGASEGPLPRLQALDELEVYEARSRGHLVRKRARFDLVDLFAGAGGLTLGFTEAFGHTFRPVWANDFNLDACRTYNANFGQHCHHGDILGLLDDDRIKIPAADVVIGGPPCQGFSLLNKNRDGDARKQMWRPYLEVVRRTGARVFVMENVPQLLGSEEHAEIAQVARSMGFRLSWTKLLASDYGVPQRRTRAFIIGYRGVDPSSAFPPRRTHHDPKIELGDEGGLSPQYVRAAQPWRTVRDAIADLDPPRGTEIRDEEGSLGLALRPEPTPISRERYETIPKEGMNRFDLQARRPDITPGCWIRKKSGGTDLFGRLWWDRPAFTVRTEFFKPEKGRYLHPKQHRPITHREAARMQTFPDSFRFLGTKIEIARQIGNAVPPLMASRVADSVYALLLASSES